MRNPSNQTKAQLIAELEVLSQRVVEMEASKVKCQYAEVALRESEERYQRITQTLTDYIYTVHIVDGRVASTIHGPACVAVTGYSSEDFAADPNLWYQMVAEEDRPAVLEQACRLLGGLDAQPVEHRITRKDGVKRWIRNTPVAHLDPNGTLIAYDGLIRDITEHKQAEEALRESEERYRAVVEGQLDLVSRYLLDTTLTFVNDAYCQFYGKTRTELIGNSCLFMIAPEFRELVKKETEDLAKDPRPLAGEYLNYRHDGQECWIQWVVLPIVGENGRVVELQAVGRDITNLKRVEEELYAAEVKLSSALKMAHFGHWEYDVSKDLFTFNDYFYDLFRTTVEQVGGYTMSADDYARRFVHPDDVPMVNGEIQKAIETTDPNFSRQLEHRMIYSDGSSGYVSVRFSVVKDDRGRTVKTYGVNQDITDRKQAEEALRESEKKYKSVIEHILDVFYRSDKSGRLIMGSPSGARMFGYASVEEMLGLPLETFWLYPAEREAVLSIVREKSMVNDLEATFVRKDGTAFPVSISAHFYYDEAGSFQGTEGIIRDITERKRAENLLRAQRDLALALGVISDLGEGLRLCLETALRLSEMDGGGVYRVDEVSGTLNLVVHQGMSPAFVVNASHYAADSPNVGLVMKGKPIYTEHLRLEIPLNETIRQENLHALAIIPIHHEDRVIGCLNVASYTMPEVPNFAQDALEMITAQIGDVIARMEAETELQQYRDHLEELVEQRTADLKAANEQLLVLSRAKDEFVSNVSHELRTPIASLKLRLRLLTNHPEHLHKHLDAISRETERLARIIEDLLQLSRLDQRRIEFQLSAVDLNMLADQYVADRAPVANDESLTLSFQGEPELPGIVADEGLLGQALSILLTNAINYTPAGGQVLVRTHTRQEADRRWGGFSVTDTGLGIPQEEQSRLFTRFFRGGAGRNSGVPGTGLGLAIAQEIIKRHGGNIEVESDGVPGHGTTFRVWMPIMDRSND